MRMSPKSYENMNKLATLCFNANAVVDNLAYSLDYHFFNEIADIVHHNVAHIMPEWADIVTNKMLELGARPVRQEIGHYEQDYKDLKEIFRVLLEMFAQMRIHVLNVIDDGDREDDPEIRIFGEDFLEKVSLYIKQSEEWINATELLTPGSLNNHIKEYTHFIAL